MTDFLLITSLVFFVVSTMMGLGGLLLGITKSGAEAKIAFLISLIAFLISIASGIVALVIKS